MDSSFFKVFLGIGLFSALGCSSISTLQDAKTLDTGKSEWVVASSFIRGEFARDSSNLEDKSIHRPALEGGYRWGFAEDWDISAKALFPAMLGIHLKHQLHDSAPWAMALGFGVSYADYRAENTNYALTDCSLPLYASIDLSQGISLYLVPRFIYRFSFRKHSEDFPLVSSSLGLRAGQEKGMISEISYAVPLASNEMLNSVQASLGYFFQR